MKIRIFSAPWCGVCTPYKKSLESAGIEFESVDITTKDGSVLAAKNKVASLPTTQILNSDDTVVHRFQGAKPVSQIKEHLL